MANAEHKELLSALRGIQDAIKDLTKEVRKATRENRQAEGDETEVAPPGPAGIIGTILSKNTYGGSKGGSNA